METQATAMCGRFTFYTPPDTLILEYFPEGMDMDGHFEPSYNIPPGTGIPMIRMSMNNTLVMAHSHWGFKPVWAGAKSPSPINARAETAATSTYFREAFAHYRCLIPANGWYEWKQTENGKTPYYIAPADPQTHPAIFFAGLWTPGQSDETTTCSIITEPADEPFRHIHQRQPVVLDPACLRDWLNPDITDRAQLRAVTHRLQSGHLRAETVSADVNNTKNDSPHLIKR